MAARAAAVAPERIAAAVEAEIVSAIGKLQEVGGPEVPAPSVAVVAVAAASARSSSSRGSSSFGGGGGSRGGGGGGRGGGRRR